MKKTDKPIADDFEDVLDMVEIGEGSDQPYEQFVGFNLTVFQPVTICHGFKGGGQIATPLAADARFGSPEVPGNSI